MAEDEPLTALERQNVDSGTQFFATEEELREYMRVWRMEHDAVLKAVAEVHGDDDADSDADDLDDYDHLFEDL